MNRSKSMAPQQLLPIQTTITGTIIPQRIKQQRRRRRLLTCLILWTLKWMFTLVLLNFYMGSQIVGSKSSARDLVKSSFFRGSSELNIHRNDDTYDTKNTNQSLLELLGNNSENYTLRSNTSFKEVSSQNGHAKTDYSSHIKDYGNVSFQINQEELQLRNGLGMKNIIPNMSDGTLQGKEKLWNMLLTRNVTQIDAEYWAEVPTWEEIENNIFPKQHFIYNYDSTNSNHATPIIYGLETCELFQNITLYDPSKRRLAPAGLFNTGTNYLNVLLDYNCQNPHRVAKFNGNAKRGHGNEWEVLWGKHNPASFRGKYYKSENNNYAISDVLPIVLIRNPYSWMKSMCRNPYSVSWEGKDDLKLCPRLRSKDNFERYQWNEVTVKFGAGSTHHRSLAHLYNDWYGEYIYNMKNKTLDGQSEITAGFYGVNNNNLENRPIAPFPRLIIRFEDIIFFPYEVTKQICTCAGGVLGHRLDDKDVTYGLFHYVVRSAKAGRGHGSTVERNGLIDSWIKYGKQNPKSGYSEEDIAAASEVLDPFIMKIFGYN